MDMQPGEFKATVELEPTTIGEMGGQLPTGVECDGEYERSFEFLPVNMGLRKRIGALADRKELRGRAGKKICYVLGKSLKSLCGESMVDKSDDERALAVAKLPVGDVFYLAFRRYQHAHKKGFPLNDFECGSCSTLLSNVKVDISSMELSRVPDGHRGPIRCEVGLEDGFEHGGARYEALQLRSPRWMDFLWKVSDHQANNSALIEAVLIEASVVASNVSSSRLTESAIEELTEEDVALISDALDSIVPQVDARVQFECPTCETATVVEVPWHATGF